MSDLPGSDRHVMVDNSQKRLGRFYGDVARCQNREIINLITGRRVLDIGCGYGYLINQIRLEKKGVELFGIDIDPEAIDMAGRLYGVNAKNMSVYKLDFPNGYFDTVILREVIHHFDSHDNLKAALTEIRRVCAKELIIFDPNPNWIVKFSRKIIRHVDPEAPYDYILKALEESGFKVNSLKWRDVVAFPMSGGFVGREFVPNIKFFKSIVMALDKFFNIILSKLRIQKHFCWRYLIYATKGSHL
jgi:SAM-dependent methyltransferase